MESRVGRLKNPEDEGSGPGKFFLIVGVVSTTIWLISMFVNDPHFAAIMDQIK